MNQEEIHVVWEGPYSYEEITNTLRDDYCDFGVYQIYGAHPIYGSDVLLYIGKADKQTFGVRLSQEGWKYNQDASRVTVYVGRLGGYKTTPNNQIWSHEIDLVERLLIVSHWPAGNSSGLNATFGEDLYPIHILNWGQFRDLLPEVSGSRYSDRFHSDDNYQTYGESRRENIST